MSQLIKPSLGSTHQQIFSNYWIALYIIHIFQTLLAVIIRKGVNAVLQLLYNTRRTHINHQFPTGNRWKLATIKSVRPNEMHNQHHNFHKLYILWHVNAFPGNGLVNKFPRRQILGKQSVARLHNNKGMSVNILTATNTGNNRRTAVSMQRRLRTWQKCRGSCVFYAVRSKKCMEQ
jgi:hypothetical protein